MKSTSLLIRVAAVCAVLLLVSAPAGAQRFKWWHSEEFKKELGLTPEQTRTLEDIFQKAVPTLKLQTAKLEEAEGKFQRLMQQGDPAAMEQINVVETARFELNKTRGQMLWNMRKVLTIEQYVKLTALQKAAGPAPGSQPGKTDNSNNSGRGK